MPPDLKATSNSPLHKSNLYRFSNFHYQHFRENYNVNMGSNKTSKKTKKPIETTLGKCPKETGEDDSHLRRPIETSVNGIKHIVALWESATLEV